MTTLEPPPVRSHLHPLPAQQLEKLGVKILNKYDLSLQCRVCGEVWFPEYLEDDSLLRGYWKCPNRCNW